MNKKSGNIPKSDDIPIGYVIYPDTMIRWGINCRRNGKFGKRISKAQANDISSKPNKGLKKITMKKHGLVFA